RAVRLTSLNVKRTEWGSEFPLLRPAVACRGRPPRRNSGVEGHPGGITRRVGSRSAERPPNTMGQKACRGFWADCGNHGIIPPPFEREKASGCERHAAGDVDIDRGRDSAGVVLLIAVLAIGTRCVSGFRSMTMASTGPMRFTRVSSPHAGSCLAMD